jgi:hypothetical protein
MSDSTGDGQGGGCGYCSEKPWWRGSPGLSVQLTNAAQVSKEAVLRRKHLEICDVAF